MPDLIRTPNKLVAKGVDLYNPVDMVPSGYYPRLTNVRALQNGRIDGRPGMSRLYQSTSTPTHTIRRLNDELPGASPAWTLLSGAGTKLDSGQTVAAEIASGFSGNPLSMVPYRPEQSPEAYMYIADSLKMCKVNAASVVRNIGIAPPLAEPAPEIGIPLYKVIDDCQATTGWTNGGTAGTISTGTRVPAACTLFVIYDSGTTGWGTFSPSVASGDYSWLKQGSRIVLTQSGGGMIAETITVEDTTADITSTTVAAVAYDSGTSGMATFALTNPTPGLKRNSLLQLNSIITRILSVTIGPDGQYSFRASIAATINPGDPVASLVSFRAYTVAAFANPDTISGADLKTTLTGSGTGTLTKSATLDLSSIGTRPVLPDDYIHLSIRTSVPANIAKGRLMFDVDGSANDFTKNFYYKEFRQNDFQSNTAGTLSSVVTQQTAIQTDLITSTDVSGQANDVYSQYQDFTQSGQSPDSGNNVNTTNTVTSIQVETGNAQWTELFVKVSELVRSGSDFTRSLQDVKAIRVELTTVVNNQNEAITGSSNAGAAVLTVATAPASGVSVTIQGYTGLWAPANGTWTATNLSGTTFSIPINSTGFGAQTGAPVLSFAGTPTTDFEIEGWWVGGTYGPDVIQNSPVGIEWRYRYRDSRTGAKSIPSPPARYDLFPMRQIIQVAVVASGDAQVDSIDVERIGGGLNTWTYVGTTTNTTGNFADTYVSSLISGNQSLETDVFQPFLVTDSPKSGTVNVAGTFITKVTGDAFNANLAPGTAIRINGIVTQTWAVPGSTSTVQITDNLGAQNGVSYKIDEPALYGQPLPVMFGPLEGPTASFVFGLGDSRNPGILYWLNGNDPDSQGQANFLEVTPPSEPLVSGCVWGTTVVVASRSRVFKITPSFTQSGNLFIATQIGTISGCYSQWGMCAGKDAVYMVGRDGIYRIDGNSVEYFSQALWPLWPHDGKPAAATNGYNPVDMTQQAYLRLSYADSAIYFHYKDSGGAIVNWKMDADGGWWHETYSPATLIHYFEELPDSSITPRMLMGTSDGYIEAASGVQDNGVDVTCTVRLPSFDNGDPRTLKLYMDAMTEINGTAQMTVGFNRFEITQAPVTVGTSTGDRQFAYSNLTSLAAIPIYSDIAVEYVFSSGTLLYEFSQSLYPQPFYGNIYTTQLKDHGFAGWKQLRYRRVAWLSVAPGTFTIINDDGVTLASQTLASTGGGLQNLFDNLPNAAKGKLLRYSVTSSTPFVLFPEETFVRIKKWGGNQFLEVRPFIEGQIRASTS